MSITRILGRIRNALVVILIGRFKWRYLSWALTEQWRLARFENIHKGDACFIIGNGPSLRLMDLSALNECHTFGLNKIYLMQQEVDLQLSYHVAVNELVVQQGFEELKRLPCPKFLSSKSIGTLRKSDDMFVLLTEGANLSFQSDLTREMSEGFTVTFVAMQLAYYMGFDEVFLIGVDHHFNETSKTEKRQFLKGDDPNHFSPDYFKDQTWDLPDLEGSELAYMLARFAFERDGRKIWDATIKGRLEVFEKISYKDALARATAK